MRFTVFIAVAVLTVFQAGCAAGFRAGGERKGVGASTAVGAPPMIVHPPPGTVTLPSYEPPRH
jgi:hypothetical protein